MRIHTTPLLRSVLLACLLALCACVPKQPAETAPAGPLLSGSATPTTLAVLPFENNSVTDPKLYEPLTTGLAAMLITDLQQAGTSLKVIERAKITALLKEIAMGQAGAVDAATAVRAGKLLGAQSIAFGSFTVLGADVRMDARIVNTETSECLMAASITGGKGDFMKLERDLAQKIAGSLKVALASRSASGGNIDAAVLFSRGVAALDQGDQAQARRLFDECLKADAAYKSQVDAALAGK